MNNGAFGEGFPYTNFHELNMDWIVKIAKDFLDQYTNIQNTITEGLEGLDNKAQELETLLQEWYDTHSEDIANQLASALLELNTWYNQHSNYLDQALADNLSSFQAQATARAEQTIASIPSDYTALYNQVTDISKRVDYNTINNGILKRSLTLNQRWPYLDMPISVKNGDKIYWRLLEYNGNQSNLDHIYMLDNINNIDYGYLTLNNSGQYISITHDAENLRIIAMQVANETNPVEIVAEFYIESDRSEKEIANTYMPFNTTIHITANTQTIVENLPISGKSGDILTVWVDNTNIISNIIVGYKYRGNNVDEQANIHVGNGIHKAYFKIGNGIDRNSLRLFVSAPYALSTGSVKVNWKNISADLEAPPASKYSSFSILGDSYSSFKNYIPSANPYWYPTNDPQAQGYGSGNNVDQVKYSWWYIVANETEMYLNKNESYSGSTICYDSYGTGTADGKAHSFITRRTEIGQSSLLFIMGGLNDYWAGASLGEYKYSNWTENDLCTFRPALAYLFDRILVSNIGTQIVFIEQELLSNEYKASIETICEHYNIPIVKLHDVSVTRDHPNITGMRAIADQVKAIMTEPLNFPFYMK